MLDKEKLERKNSSAENVDVDVDVGGLCTRRVMVMEAVEGEPVKKRMSRVFADMAAAQGKSVEVLKREMRAEFEDPAKLRKMLTAPPPSETMARGCVCASSIACTCF